MSSVKSPPRSARQSPRGGCGFPLRRNSISHSCIFHAAISSSCRMLGRRKRPAPAGCARARGRRQRAVRAAATSSRAGVVAAASLLPRRVLPCVVVANRRLATSDSRPHPRVVLLLRHGDSSGHPVARLDEGLRISSPALATTSIILGSTGCRRCLPGPLSVVELPQAEAVADDPRLGMPHLLGHHRARLAETGGTLQTVGGDLQHPHLSARSLIPMPRPEDRSRRSPAQTRLRDAPGAKAKARRIYQKLQIGRTAADSRLDLHPRSMPTIGLAHPISHRHGG